MPTRLRTSLALTPLLLALAACGGDTDEPDASAPSSSTTSAPATTSTVPAPGSTLAPVRAPKVLGTVASGLEVPWGIGFLPDGSALVTERDNGRVLQITGKTVTEVGTVDETRAEGEAGLLGLAVSPTFASDRTIYLYTTTDSDNRVLRARFVNGRLSATTAILTGIPNGYIHDGGRLAFGPDGFLYVSTGERGEPALAQDPDSLGGKVLRITTAGKPAPGNPDPSSPIWTLGHRNVQGLAFNDNGRLWASEFGQDTWDELNLISAGTNYGWPRVEGRSGNGRYRNPQQQWRTDDASPSGLAFLDGHLWMASLKGQRLWRVTVDGAKAVAPKGFFVGTYGRMRTAVAAPDGRLWVTTSNRDGRGDPQDGDDQILLVDPGTS